MQYRRARIQGGTYFFTVVTHERQQILTADKNIELLRAGFQYVMQNHPFRINVYVILPDHLHFIWTLPDGDRDFSTKWRLIKSYFTRNFDAGYSPWQKKLWEHLIRNERDLKSHVEYIHYNPVKYDLVQLPVDWPFSSIHRYIFDGLYSPNWGESEPVFLDDRLGSE